MLFNSISFLVFFVVVTTAYFLMPFRYRWVLLLSSSYFFYMCWNPTHIFLMIFSTLISFYTGQYMARAEKRSTKKMCLVLSLVLNLSVLFFFKYYNFINDSFRIVFNQFNYSYVLPSFNMLLPIGISFYTFHTLSYSIDIYRGIKKPEKHLVIFALYVAYFPQLVAGPIARASKLLPQLYEEHSFDYDRVTDGLKLMLWGFFKKLVIADRLAIYVNQVYNNPSEYHGAPLIIATYFFAFQIYCDFSGYSDIAIGGAQVLGVDLIDNFKRPYFSKSIPEFWRRWHISLSTWFKDYVYIALGGSRVHKWRWYYNVFIVFLISGLWHGANWTFAVWGGLHGFYYLCSIWTADFRERLTAYFRLPEYPFIRKVLQVFITFHLVLLAWIFFRASSISDAFMIINNMFSGLSNLDPDSIWVVGKAEFLVSVMSIVFMECIHLVQRHKKMRKFFSEKPLGIRWAVYYLIIFSTLIFGVFTSNQFIYFQF
ncbi:MAG: MBOAT family protein [Nitrospirae bacterium]|nr:MBOAT family protein [Nitrospirota bacterium]